MNRLAAMTASLLLAFCAGRALAGDDRLPTTEERAQIEAALRAEGFTRWGAIELDDGVWEVDDAIGADNREYDLKLDSGWKIISRDPD